MSSLGEVYLGIEEDDFWDYLRVPGINFVPGYGCDTEPRVLIVGSAPDATDNTRRRPFSGPSGRVLEQLMELASLAAVDREIDGGLNGDVPLSANAFLTNVLKYRPEGTRPPSAAEIAHGTKELRAEYAALGSPPAIIAVGATAHQAVSPSLSSLTASLGIWHNVSGVWITSVLHPAYALHKQDARLQEAMEVNWEEIGKFLAEEGVTP